VTNLETAPELDTPELCTDAVCADLITTLRRYEPATAARMTRRRVTRRPLSEIVPEVVVFGRVNSGKTTLVRALDALADGKVHYREWQPADGDGQGPAVVLVVFDASNPIASADLNELRELGSAVDSVVFALTKTDVNQNWRQVRDRNAQLLAIHTSRFSRVTIHPVATPLAQAANDHRGSDPKAARLLAESAGVTALH
jgi:predicted GTPase